MVYLRDNQLQVSTFIRPKLYFFCKSGRNNGILELLKLIIVILRYGKNENRGF